MAPERSCIVVGAGPGLGMAVGRRFAAGGFAVAAISRRAPDVSDLGPGHLGLAADAGDLSTTFSVNVGGALAAAQAVLPALGETGGTILATGGAGGLHPTAAYAGLGVTKAALRALAIALHEDLRPMGVHATTVTISGGIGSSDTMAPDRIPERCWAIHERPEERWQAEEAYP